MSFLSRHRLDSAGAALFCCQSETLTSPHFSVVFFLRFACYFRFYSYICSGIKVDAIDQLWDEGVLNDSVIEGWKNEHMRTPYKQ